MERRACTTRFSVEWWEMLKFAASEAKRVGLSFEINLSNGYVAGGPWITKALSMQRLTASDTIIRGKQQFAAVLPAPGDDEFGILQYWRFLFLKING